MTPDLSLGGFTVLVAAVCAYMAPAIIAFRYGHPQKFMVAAINLFFGWMAVGWIVAAVCCLVGLIEFTVTIDSPRSDAERT